MKSREDAHIFLIITTLVVTALFVVISCWMGSDVAMQLQLNLYDKLRDISAIILAISGAWLAIVFPDGLTSLISDRGEVSTKDKERIVCLSIPMAISVFVVIVTFLVEYSAPLFRQCGWCCVHYQELRRISFVMLTLLMLFEFWSIILSMIAVQFFKDDCDHTGRKKQVFDARSKVIR